MGIGGPTAAAALNMIIFQLLKAEWGPTRIQCIGIWYLVERRPTKFLELEYDHPDSFFVLAPPYPEQ